jgi:hypothetical protein
MVSIRTCSCAASLIRPQRTSGPWDRRNGALASACSRLPSAARGCAAPDRSVTLISGSRPGATNWTTSCRSLARTTVRSVSCRRTISLTASRKAGTSSAPLNRQTAGMLCGPQPASSWSMNHSRCCAKEAGKQSTLVGGTEDTSFDRIERYFTWDSLLRLNGVMSTQCWRMYSRQSSLD